MRLRKNQSHAPDGTRRERDRRGLGPFSGGQLTIIIVTFAVLLLFPIGAWALSFSNVAITDPGGVNQAKVDAGHHLLVGDGSGALTVDGSVAGRPLPPSSPFEFSNNTPVGSTFVVGPAAVSTAINLTSLTISVPANQNADLRLIGWFQPGTATTCSTAGFSITIWHAQNITGNFTVSFPTPLQTRPPTGSKICLAVLNPFQDQFTPVVNGSGFVGN